jgi:hypothetical protein
MDHRLIGRASVKTCLAAAVCLFVVDFMLNSFRLRVSQSSEQNGSIVNG